jgi:hypothetical protein
MSEVRGLSSSSPFVRLVGDPDVAALLTYVHGSWSDYVTLFRVSSPPFQQRSETQLTQALAAHLRRKQDAGQQQLPGHFFGELSQYDLDDVSGLPKCVARTDIEWRLYGKPALIIEFKILDGRKQRRTKYLLDGVMRFVVGRYSGETAAGAMFGLLRKKASKDPDLIRVALGKKDPEFQCQEVKNGSQLLPSIATFDSIHQRKSPHVTPFRLAHLFFALP